jgi:serine phosphatase RsbU (regulator of sigma subunit)
VASSSYKESTIHLSAGDHLSLYTDGLLEARSATGELYGFDRLRTLFAEQPDAAKATEAAVAFGQDDDITVLTLTRLGLGEASSARFTTPVFESAG